VHINGFESCDGRTGLYEYEMSTDSEKVSITDSREGISSRRICGVSENEEIVAAELAVVE